ncbi:MAG: hypothetical protein WCR95_06090 [Eubacteriales bacterium]
MSCQPERPARCCIGAFVGLGFGVLVGTLFALGFIPVMINAVFAAFSLGSLILAMLVAASSGCNPAMLRCLRKRFPCLLTGVVGTVLLTLTSMVIPLDPASALVAAIVAAAAFFFAYMITELIMLISCAVNEGCAFKDGRGC